MFSIIQRLSSVWPIITAALAAWTGVEYSHVADAGMATGPQSMGLGALTFGTGISLFLSVISNWKKSGGKLDGTVTKEELESVAGTLLPNREELIKKFSPEAAALVNLLGQYVSGKFSNSQFAVFAESKTLDHQDRSLVWSLVDSLATILKGDIKGEDAVAVIRVRLDELFFPATSPGAAPIPVA